MACRMVQGVLVWLLFIACVPGTWAQVSLPEIIRNVEPSVVVVLTYTSEGKLAGQGTGFFVDEAGEVITNYHVVRGAIHSHVRTIDGKIYPVKEVLAEDGEGDLVRLSLELSGDVVKPLRVSSAIPEVGEHILVIGTPLGLERTVSDGIVSAVRNIPRFGTILQLTAPISQGSSGSPVVNMKGLVVGIISFFVSHGQSLNFAIPGERIAKLVPDQRRTLREWAAAGRENATAHILTLYATGLRYVLLEDYERALTFFLEVLRLNPDHSGAAFQAGYCLAGLERHRDAIDWYERAIKLKPGGADAYNNLCVSYNKVGQWVKALESCQEAVRIKPDLAEAHNNLAWSYHKLGRFREAIESCNQAIKLKPDYAVAYYNLGNNYAALGRYQEAIEAYKQTIRFDPDHAEGHMNLGAAYSQRGKYEKAIQSYEQAIRLKPDLAAAHMNIGMAYLKLGDRGSALEEYKVLMKLDKRMANQLFRLIYE